ncbi:MAG: hypothetical protein AAF821_01935 [Cyanobacteria bacterium P01_D01_bin.156]
MPHDAPFTAQVALSFDASNAVALLALNPTIQIDFYIKPLQAGSTIDVGNIALVTNSQERLYTLQLDIASPAELNLDKSKVYRLGALVRIGAPENPALLCGVVEELMIQLYTSEKLSQASKKAQKNTSKKHFKTKK